MYSFYIRDQWQATRNLTINYRNAIRILPAADPLGSRHGALQLRHESDADLRHRQRTEELRHEGRQALLLSAPRNRLSSQRKDGHPKRVWHQLGSVESRASAAHQLSGSGRAEHRPSDFAWLGDHTDAGACLQVPVPDLGNGIIPVPGNYAVTTTDDSYTRGYILNWNFTIERQLPGNFAGQVGYVANRSVHTPSVLDLNAGQVPGADRAGQPLFAKFGRTAGTSLVDGNSLFDVSLVASAAQPALLAAASNSAPPILGRRSSGCAAKRKTMRGPRIKALNYLDLNRTVLNSDRTHNLPVQRDV